MKNGRKEFRALRQNFYFAWFKCLKHVMSSETRINFSERYMDSQVNNEAEKNKKSEIFFRFLRIVFLGE
jgi:hypothetical protein